MATTTPKTIDLGGRTLVVIRDPEQEKLLEEILLRLRAIRERMEEEG